LQVPLKDLMSPFELSRPDAGETERMIVLGVVSPILRLHGEVLISIFLLCRDACVLSPIPSIKDDLSWLAVTRVCSIWRNTALEYPLLWNHITFNIAHREVYHTLSQRARGTSNLYVRILSEDNIIAPLDTHEQKLQRKMQHSRLLLDCLSEMKGIRSLTLAGIGLADYVAAMDSHWGSSHSSLEEGNVMDRFAPTTLFGYVSSGLTSLSLIRCSFDWTVVKHLSHLRSLLVHAETHSCA
jgi:hypothetical protein